jgi:hypothetical protein
MKKHSIQLCSWKIISITIAVIVLASCVRRDLEEMPTRGSLNLFFDWSELGSLDTIPTSMKVLFYNAVGDTLGAYGESGEQQVDLPFGEYKMLTYNTTAQGVSFRNLEDVSLAEAYAVPLSESALLANRYTKSTGSYLSQPRNLYGIGGDTVNLLLGNVCRDTLKPQTLIRQIALDIQIAGDISTVVSCNLSLENIASSVSLLTGKPVCGNPGIIALESDKNASGFGATVHYFGKDTTAVSHVLSLVLVFTDGGEQTVSTDFSAAMDSAEETTIPVNVKVDVDVTHTDAGFKANLKGWSIEKETIVINE